MAKVSIINRAREFAIKAHSDQQYGTGKPYAYHLAKVADVLDRFHVKSNNMRAAAWLHDTLEDTKATLMDLNYQFGFNIADLVWAVTDAPGKNRAERHRKTFPKILATGPDAVILKLADRIANVEEGLYYGPTDKLKMYVQEYPEFARALCVPIHACGIGLDKWASPIPPPPCQIEEMWTHLESICDPVQGLREVLIDVMPHIVDESRHGMVERAIKAYRK